MTPREARLLAAKHAYGDAGIRGTVLCWVDGSPDAWLPYTGRSRSVPALAKLLLEATSADTVGLLSLLQEAVDRDRFGPDPVVDRSWLNRARAALGMPAEEAD